MSRIRNGTNISHSFNTNTNTNTNTTPHIDNSNKTAVWIKTSALPQKRNDDDDISSATPPSWMGRRNTPSSRSPSPTTLDSSKSDWGWAKGFVLSQTCTTEYSSSSSPSSLSSSSSPISNNGKSYVAPNNSLSNSKTIVTSSSPWRKQKQTSTTTPSPSTRNRVRPRQAITVTINDTTYPQYNGLIITFQPDDVDKNIAMANSWEVHRMYSSSSSSQHHHHTNNNNNNNNNNTDLELKPPNDLVELTHLHEPAIVHCLQARYEVDEIYTYTGQILLALNPFKKCDDLYSKCSMERYWLYGRGGGGGGGGVVVPPPHVYAVADMAFRAMMREMEDGRVINAAGGGSSRRGDRTTTSTTTTTTTMKSADQSILVSGESGAGKTVTTRIVMRYLATLSKRSASSNVAVVGGDVNGNCHDDGESDGGDGEGVGSIEQKVLQSNPILESFGNARTIRNDNSSRFGKFTEIKFELSGRLNGASIITYLLEKVRLITQAPGERNYHIFYELLVGLSNREKKEFYVGGASALDFKMTSMSGTFDRRDGVQDYDTYRDLREAMNTLGFESETQKDIMKTTCALLHASNLTFLETSCDASKVDRSNPSLGPTLALMGVSSDVLNDALCTSTIEARGEKLVKNQTVEQATKALEALIKATYGALFKYIVELVNESITVKKSSNETRNSQAGQHLLAVIGLLDIFGFERFAVNSFEQLCINYCNETLQQQFNRFVFKMEQKEYEREGIEWSFIQFPDNQDVLDLIEKKHTGILSILDEQCRLAKCTDRSFANATYEKCSEHPHFESSHTQKVNGQFSVQHYAGDVEYDSTSFLEKNKDELPKESTDFLMSSSNPILPLLGRMLSEADYSASSGKQQRNGALQRSSSSLARTTVGSQFTCQLRQLRERIELTSPHYVRCLKPNDELIPDKFDCYSISNQLRCAGVLEAVRVSRVGYPQRYPHLMFLQRYRVLSAQHSKKASWRGEKELCHSLVQSIAPVIIEAQQSGDAKEDKDVSSKMKYSASSQDIFITVGIQLGKTKVFLRRHAFECLEELRTRKFNTASTLIQSVLRMFLLRCSYVRKLESIILIQCAFRRFTACLQVQTVRLNHCAVIVQQYWRSFFARKIFQANVFIAKWCQRVHRGRLGRAKYLQMNRERKSILIQSCWRMCVDRNIFQTKRHLASTLQVLTRSFIARKTFRQLKREAKDLSLVVSERDELRKETKRLRDELDRARQRCGTGAGQSNERLMPIEASTEEVALLRMEVDRLQRELSISMHKQPTTPTYRDFPKNPTDQEEEILSLARMCAEKDRELEFLRREIQVLQKKEKVTMFSPLMKKQMLRNHISSPTSSYDNEHQRDEGCATRSDTSPKREETHQGRFFPFSPAQMFMGMRGLIGNDDSSDPNPNADEAKASFAAIMTTTSLLDNENAGIGEAPEQCQPSLLDTSSCGSSIGSYNNEAEADVNCNDIVSTPFHEGVIASNKSVLSDAIANTDDVHADINKGDHDGRTPLHVASLKSDLQIASFLIDHHAVVNSQDHACNTPLHFASTAQMLELLLDVGGANPNIPNSDGLCALHLAVLKRDADSVKCLIEHGIDINTADNLKWCTPLHLVARQETPTYPSLSFSEAQPVALTHCGKIAELLCTVESPSKPDFNFQDIEGNTPLHYAAMRSDDAAADLLALFLQNGADPAIQNNSEQSPMLLLCHNIELRRFDFFQEILCMMLSNGADPNQSSRTGCTSLHLALYHQDIDSAVQLVRNGADLNPPWQKPSKWKTFWSEVSPSTVLPMDMVEDQGSLRRVLSAITKPQKWAPPRPRCMQCRTQFGTFTRQHHCRHCGRLVCGVCSPRKVEVSCFRGLSGELDSSEDSLRACIICEDILTCPQINEDNDANTDLSANEPKIK